MQSLDFPTCSVQQRRSYLERAASQAGHGLREEAGVLVGIRHPNVVQLWGFCPEPNFWIVMEYCSLGSLRDWIQGHPGCRSPGNPDFLEAIRFTQHIALGMHCIHTKGFLHLDLKPSNVLLKDTVILLSNSIVLAFGALDLLLHRVGVVFRLVSVLPWFNRGRA